jgi:putative membrane protein
MSGDRPRGPRILDDAVEMPPAPAARIDFGWEQAVAPPEPPKPDRRWSALSLAAGGIAVLLLGLSLLEVVNFIADQFARSQLLGWLTLAVAVLGYGMIAWAFLREVRELMRVTEVDKARAAFARGDFVAARAEALAWAARVPAAQGVLPALRGANDLDSIVALLQAGPVAALDRDAAAAGRAAAAQAFAATAVVPSPALDAVFFAWRGVRLVREVAAIHGLRPGIVGTLALLRRAIFEAGTVAVADVAIDAATRAIVTNPLIEKLAGEAGKGAVAARRMLMLSRAAGRACRILP